MAFVCIWIIAGTLLQKWYAVAFVDHAVSDTGTVLGKIKFKLDVNGITEIGKGYKSTFAWSSIQIVKKENDCLFLFTDLIKAVILPIRDLSDSKAAELSEILKEHTSFD